LLKDNYLRKNLPKIAVVLKGLRGREGMRQKDLAKKCDICKEIIAQIEQGKRIPSPILIQKMAIALNTSIEIFDC